VHAVVGVGYTTLVPEFGEGDEGYFWWGVFVEFGFFFFVVLGFIFDGFGLGLGGFGLGFALALLALGCFGGYLLDWFILVVVLIFLFNFSLLLWSPCTTCRLPAGLGLCRGC